MLKTALKAVRISIFLVGIIVKKREKFYLHFPGD